METTELSMDDAVAALVNVPAPEEALAEPEQDTVSEDTTDDVVDEQESDVVDDDIDVAEEVTESEGIAEETADEVEQSPETETYTVKVDGEEFEVTLEDLKRGYSGQQYVQKGMKQAAEARKEAEAVYSDLLQARQAVVDMAQKMQSGEFLAKPQEPSQSMFDTDPIGYMEARMRYDDQLKAYNEQVGQVQQMTERQSEAEKRARAVYLQQEALQLKAMIPELGDADKAAKWLGDIINAAAKYGYTEQQISNMVSAKDFLALNDLMKYQQLMASKEQAQKKVKAAKPVVKAGSKRNVDAKAAQRKRQLEKLNKSGRIDDAVSLIMNI